MKRAVKILAPALGILLAGPVWADPAPFDLVGPKLQVSVTRHGVTLPIASVPQMSAGDKVTVEAVLPASETAHYMLVAGFLRDPTNPPPDAWFAKSETWKRAGRGGGAIALTVPADAQHLALFLAPAAGGDFLTLRKAVKSRPGAFVRAAQDLEQASLDRARFDAYLAAIRKVAASAPDTLPRIAPLVANSLHIKINDDCLQRQPELQAPCLLDTKQSVVLGSDGAADSTSLAGAATDLALSLSATPTGGLGYYSPYISAIREIVGIFSAMHSAKYQYIPALAVAQGDKLSLLLNTPPSFANPKSVLMASLPEIKPGRAPVLQMPVTAIAPCLGVKDALLPITVNPLFYTTAYANDLKLHVHMPGGSPVELSLTPDPVRGGLVIGNGGSLAKVGPEPLSATVHGMWGFDPFTGPEVSLQVAGDWRWQRKEDGKDESALTLVGAASACVSSVTVTPAQGNLQAAVWKITGPREISVSLPAARDKRAPLTLAIKGPDGIIPAQLTITPLAKPLPAAARIVAKFSAPPPAEPAASLAILLDDPDEIPATSRFSFTLKAAGNEQFTGREAVEIGTANSDATVRMAFGSGLTLVDRKVIVASLTPAQVLGASAYGPLRARLVRGDVAGDWLALGTLVRLPHLKALNCPAAPSSRCLLQGDSLYLLASVSAARDFDAATAIAEGYPGTTLPVPRPTSQDSVIFVRLHDVPEVVNRVKLAIPANSAK